MRVLIDVVHPAHALFFHRPIQMFRARGDAVIVASRAKDVTCQLLDQLGHEHQPISSAGSGLLGLGWELVRRDAALARLARRFRPDVMLGNSGVAISHVGRLLRIPSIAFADTETAPLQIRLSWPFLHRIVVPDDWEGPLPAGRSERLKGMKALSYFHPDHFQPDRARAIAAGLAPDRPNILIRLVEWKANHDIGKSGWSADVAATVVDALAPVAKLHVSAEGAAAEAFQPHLWRGAPSDLHHLMGHCDAVIGESCTIACEAAVLGVPALYAGVDMPGYVKGMARRGLIAALPPGRRAEIPAVAKALIAEKDAFLARRAAWLAEAPDWAEAVVAVAERMAAGRA